MPDLQDASIETKEVGFTGLGLDGEDNERPEVLYWIDEWIDFRTATALGQMEISGQPALKRYKEDDTYELGVMRRSSSGGTHFKKIMERGSREDMEEALAQAREAYEEDPVTHRGTDQLDDGWERLLKESEA